MLLNWTTAIVWLYMAGRKSIHWPKNAMPRTIAGTVITAVPLQLVVIDPPLTSLLDQQQQTQAAFEKYVFSRQLSVHFGSMRFLWCSIVLTSGLYVDSSGGGAASPARGIDILPRVRHNGASEKLHGCILQQSLSPPCRSSIWTSESQSQRSCPPIPSPPWLR